jgi:hypothetical protein
MQMGWISAVNIEKKKCNMSTSDDIVNEFNFTCEFNRGGQLDQGDVIADTKRGPVGVDGVVKRSDLNASRFIGSSQTNVVGSQQDVEEDSTLGTIYV